MSGMTMHGQINPEKMAPWRKDLPREHIRRIAAQERFERAPLIEYYQECNAAVQSHLHLILGRDRNTERHSSSSPPGRDPERPGEIARGEKIGYDMAIVQCPDARHAYLDLELLLAHRIIHQRTAGSTVIRAAMFPNLREGGFALVEGHKECGACKAAHELEKSTDAEVHYTIARIVDAIEYYIRIEPDPEIRDRLNARKQAFTAEEKMETLGRNEYVYPAFFSWDQGKPNLEWLDEWVSPKLPVAQRKNILGKMSRWERIMSLHSNPYKNKLEEAAAKNLQYAMAEGRNFTKQYAGMAILYDPYRLDRITSVRPGCINDPRPILGLLGDEAFATSMDLRPFDPKFSISQEKVSRTAMGSIIYAAFDKHNGHYGHVGGVGGHDGTHLLGIMDVSEQVLERLTRHLVDTHPIIAELTNRGRDIIKMLYRPDTVKVEFLKG